MTPQKGTEMTLLANDERMREPCPKPRNPVPRTTSGGEYTVTKPGKPKTPQWDASIAPLLDCPMNITRPGDEPTKADRSGLANSAIARKEPPRAPAKSTRGPVVRA